MTVFKKIQDRGIFPAKSKEAGKLSVQKTGYC